MCSIIRSNSTKCYCNSTTTTITSTTTKTKKTLTTLSSLSSLLSISNGIGTNRRLFIILFITIGLLSSTIDGRRSRPPPQTSSASNAASNNHDLDVEYLEEEEDDFDCPEKFGYYPDVTNCSRYHICDHGKSALKSCDDGLVFSTVLKTCDWPYNVHCNLANGDRGDFIGTHLRLREDGDNDLSLGNRRQPVLSNEADDSYWLGKPDTDFLAYLNDEEDYHDHYSPNDQEFDIPRRKPYRQPQPNRSPDEPAEEDDAHVGGAVDPNQPWFESFEHARRRNQNSNNNQRPSNPITTTPVSAAPILSTNQRGTTGWRSRNRPVVNNPPTPSTTTGSTTQATSPTPLLPRRALRIGHNPDLNDQDDYLLTDDPGNALINDDDGDYNRRQTLKDDRDSYRIVSHNRHSPTTTQTPPTTPAAITLPPRLPAWTKPPPPQIQSQPQSHFTTPTPTGVLLKSQPRHLGTSVRRKVVRKKIVSPKPQQSYTTPAPLTTTATPTTIATTSAQWNNNNNNFWNTNNQNTNVNNNNNNNNNNDPWNAFRYETINRNNSNTNSFNNQNGPHKISSIRRTVPKLNNQQRFERKPVLRDDHEADPEDHPSTRGHGNDAEDESYFYNTPDIIRHRSAAGLNTSVVVNDLLPKNVVKDVSNNLNNGRYPSGRSSSPNSGSRPAPVPPANTNNQFLNKAFDLGFHHAINPLNQGVPRAPFTGGASHDIEYEDLENEDEDENVEDATDDDDESNNNVSSGKVANFPTNPGSGGRQPLNKEIVVRYDDDETDDSIVSINDPRRPNHHHQNHHQQNQTISRFVGSTPRRTTPTPSPARYTRFIDGAATLAPGNNFNNINHQTNGTNNKKLNSAIRILDLTAPEHHHLEDLAPILAPARIHHHDKPHDMLSQPVPFVTIIGPLKKNNRNYNPKIHNHNHNNIYNIPAQPSLLSGGGSGQRSVLQPSLLPPLPQIPGGSQLFSNTNNNNNNNNSPWNSSGKPVATSNKKVKKNKQVKQHKSPKSTPNPKSMKNMFYQRAKRCSPDKCQLPNCFCGGTNIPGGFQPKEIPQIVLLTFDDSVNDLNRDIYRRLFEQGRTNPNGCPISATFYVSHEWTDYSQVQNLYAKGHEIASHSISHSFGEKFSKERWLDEILGQKEILSLYGGVDKQEIRGMRAPFLQTGGDTMFEMLHQANFSYDSSLPVYDIDPPYWPYTLDFAIGHDCMIEPCPSNSYPGFWEVGMVMWEDLRGGRCSMADGCFNPSDEQGVYEMVKQNFLRHYTSNRAPFGMYFHSRWFLTEHNMKGFVRFLDEMLQMDDIYLVTNYQMIQWMQHPTPLPRVKQFKPFGCDYIQQRPPLCKAPHTCKARFRGEIRTLKTCQQCPTTYPWTGNNGHE